MQKILIFTKIQKTWPKHLSCPVSSPWLLPTFLENLALSERRGIRDIAPLPVLGRNSEELFSGSPENSVAEPFSAPPIVDNLKQQKIFTFEPLVLPNCTEPTPETHYGKESEELEGTPSESSGDSGFPKSVPLPSLSPKEDFEASEKNEPSIPEKSFTVVSELPGISPATSISPFVCYESQRQSTLATNRSNASSAIRSVSCS